MDGPTEATTYSRSHHQQREELPAKTTFEPRTASLCLLAAVINQRVLDLSPRWTVCGLRLVFLDAKPAPEFLFLRLHTAT